MDENKNEVKKPEEKVEKIAKTEEKKVAEVKKEEPKFEKVSKKEADKINKTKNKENKKEKNKNTKTDKKKKWVPTAIVAIAVIAIIAVLTVMIVVSSDPKKSLDGLLTNLCFSSSGKYHNYDLLGFNVLSNGTTGGMEYGYADIELDVDIPKNFKVISAYISLYHTPAYWAYYDSSSHETYGYSRNLKIYKASSLSNYSFYMTYASEYQFGSNDIQLSEITNAFGNVTYTPTNTTGNGIEIKNSINIKDFLSTGSNKLVIRTSDAIPTNNEGACCIKTGMARAVINIIGYMSG